MKCHFCVSALLLLSVLTLPSQARSNQARQHLRQRHQDFLAATTRGDAAQMAQFLTDDYVVTGVDGKLSDRTTALAAVKGNSGGQVEMKESEVQIRLLRDTGIVTGIIHWKAGDASGQVRFTEVWVKPKGRWLLAVAQATPVQSKT